MANIHTEWQTSVSEVLNLSDVLPHERMHPINLPSLDTTTLCHPWPAEQMYVINAVPCTEYGRIRTLSAMTGTSGSE